jgi:hypothetical protein
MREGREGSAPIIFLQGQLCDSFKRHKKTGERIYGFHIIKNVSKMHEIAFCKLVKMIRGTMPRGGRTIRSTPFVWG